MRTTRRFIGSLLGREQNRAMLESSMGIGCTCRGGDVGRCACELSEWMSDAGAVAKGCGGERDGINEEEEAETEAAWGTGMGAGTGMSGLTHSVGGTVAGGGQEKGIG